MISRAMGKAGVYRDDHHPSVWHGIAHGPGIWTRLAVTMTNGETYICDITELDAAPLPDDLWLLNEDGIGLHVTSVMHADGSVEERDPEWHGRWQIMYLPRAKIERFSVLKR